MGVTIEKETSEEMPLEGSERHSETHKVVGTYFDKNRNAYVTEGLTGPLWWSPAKNLDILVLEPVMYKITREKSSHV